MDTNLLSQAVSQRGADLIVCLQAEQQGRLPPGLVQHLSRHCNTPTPQHEINDDEFQRNVNQFIAKKSDMIFTSVNNKSRVSVHEHEVEDNYAIMPALESFMGIPSTVCKEHFFNSVEKHDIVIGVVTSVMEAGLLVSLLCLDNGRARDIDDLKIMAFCPAKEVPKIVPDQQALESFHVKDIVRGIVLNVNPETQRTIISLQDKSATLDVYIPPLGLIKAEEFPVHYRRKLHVRGLMFDELLQSIVGFNNSGNVDYLLEHHNLKDDSIMRGLHSLKVPEKEYAENLRKWQCQKMALQSVAQGVALFKKGKQMEAMQHLNKALQIDETNVEALVARGALYANNESFARAVEDFEAALKVNPTHANATKYLLETRLAQGKLCEDQKDYLRARECYQQAVHVDPTSREAISTLLELEQKLVRSGVTKRKDDGKKARRSLDDSPRYDRDRSPRRSVDSRKYRDESSRRYRDDSPRRFRDESPRRYREESPRRFREESPRRFRDESPGRYREESPRRFRENSPQHYRNASPVRYGDESPRRYREDLPPQSDKLSFLMEESNRDFRKSDKKRKSSQEAERSDPKQRREKKERVGQDKRTSDMMQKRAEELASNPYASIFNRSEVSIPGFGSPEKPVEELFPEGYCNPQDPNFVPKISRPREASTSGRLILTTQDEYDDYMRMNVSHGDSSPTEFDRSHSPKSAKSSKSPFDEEAFLYGESEIETLPSKPRGILKHQSSNEWDEQGGIGSKSRKTKKEKRSRKSPSTSPEWEGRSQKVVRLESPKKRRRRSNSSSSSSSGSSSSSSSSSSSDSEAAGDFYEKRGAPLPKGLQTAASFMDTDYQEDYPDQKRPKSLKERELKSGKGRSEKSEKKLEKVKGSKKKVEQKKDKQTQDKKKSGKQVRQTSLDRESNASGRSGPRDDLSVSGERSGSIKKDSQRKTDKHDPKLMDPKQKEKKRWKKTLGAGDTPEKVIQDASISSLSERLDTSKDPRKDPRMEELKSQPEDPLSSRSLFHIASKWDSPPMEVKLRSDGKRYENIQISISTATPVEQDPSGLRIFSGKQLSKHRADKARPKEDSSDDELERLFQKEKKVEVPLKKGFKIQPVQKDVQKYETPKKKLDAPKKKIDVPKKMVDVSKKKEQPPKKKASPPPPPAAPLSPRSLAAKIALRIDSRYNYVEKSDKDKDEKRSERDYGSKSHGRGYRDDKYDRRRSGDSRSRDYDDDRRRSGDDNRRRIGYEDRRRGGDEDRSRGGDEDRRRFDDVDRRRFDDEDRRRFDDEDRHRGADEERHRFGDEDRRRFDNEDRRRIGDDNRRHSNEFRRQGDDRRQSLEHGRDMRKFSKNTQHESGQGFRGNKGAPFDDLGDDFDYTRMDVRPRIGTNRKCDKYCKPNHDIITFHEFENFSLYGGNPGTSPQKDDRYSRSSSSSSSRSRSRSRSREGSQTRDHSAQRSGSHSHSRNQSQDPAQKKVLEPETMTDTPALKEDKQSEDTGSKEEDPGTKEEEDLEAPNTSLDDLESFLNNLKDKKKQQWIAEGKVKTAT